MSDIFGKLKSGAGKVVGKVDETVDIKRIEMQIGSIKKQIEDQYQKLGQVTYDSKVKKEPENPEVAGIIEKVTELKQMIVAKEEEIKNRKEDKVVSQVAAPVSQVAAPVSQVAAPGNKFCTNCGKENDANSKFCNDCGAKMG
ncbi:zinc-ribbon domain-containing protein [Candidatus Bathyarchaeota archaeon]|nr:zinc-ribbon domain-containing protein [Candidatus Bathyarchaeota archaeon]